MASYFHYINVLIGNNIHMTAQIRQGIQASIHCKHKAWTGFEPMIFGLRDKQLATWPTCQDQAGPPWLRKKRILQRNVCFSYFQIPLKNNLNRAICSVLCSNEQTTIETVSFKNLTRMGGWIHDLWFSRPSPSHLGTTARTASKQPKQNNMFSRVSFIQQRTNTIKIMMLCMSLTSYFHDINVLNDELANNIHKTGYIRQGIRAAIICTHKAWMGVEPMIFGLRDQRLSTWPPRHWQAGDSSLR